MEIRACDGRIVHPTGHRIQQLRPSATARCRHLEVEFEVEVRAHPPPVGFMQRPGDEQLRVAGLPATQVAAQTPLAQAASILPLS